MAQKIRYSDKSFGWRRPDGNGGHIYNRKGVPPVLYNLPILSDAECVYLVEGEKDVGTLAKYERCATSVPDGAKTKWRDEFTEVLRGKQVAIIPDNDEPGQKLAITAANALHGVAKSVKVLDLTQIWPEMPEKGDVSDLINHMNGTGMDAVSQLVADTPEYSPVESSAGTGLVCLGDVESTKVKWLWYPYIPLGKITLMQADPGTGKTYLSLAIAAAVSAGRGFYMEDEFTRHEPGVVIYQTAEDGLSDTIKPRLDQMNPDFKNIFVINEETEGLTLSDERIENALKSVKPKLLIIDPLQAYLGSDVDMHRANEVRPVLAKIGRLAEQYECAVIFVMHMSKMTQTSALYRALGSIDIPAVARSMLILGRHPENPEQRIICHEKSSLAKPGASILFSIDPSQGGVIFEGTSELSADEVLNVRKGARGKSSATLDEAVSLLDDMLQKKGFVQLSKVKETAETEGISQRTLYRARDELGLKALSLGFGADKKTWWMLPDVETEKVEEAQSVAEAENVENPFVPGQTEIANSLARA